MSDVLALIAQSQSGDEAAAEMLIEENSGLIWSVAKRFTGRGVETEDLYQLGCIGSLLLCVGFL